MIRIGTRSSALALAQARLVAAALPGAEIITIERLRERLAAGGGPAVEPAPHDKARWVAVLEQALLADQIDIAVHSAKDLPGEQSAGLALLASPRRADPGDLLLLAEPAGAGGSTAARPNQPARADLQALPDGARVGTGSLRRMAQLRAARDDLQILPLAGNVDTRLARLDERWRDLDAIVLAAAGLARLQIARPHSAPLDHRRFVPAPGQGALALQGRAGDASSAAAAGQLNDDCALACLLAERALAARLGATCNTPIGAFAQPLSAALSADARDGGEDRRTGADGGELRLLGWVGLPDGSVWLRDELSAPAIDAAALGAALGERMLSAGARDLLEQAETMAMADA